MVTSKRLSKAERKREIMASASKQIIAKGFSNTTMEDVIAGTTMSKGGVYHYYKNTLDIFKDLMLEGLAYRNKIIQEHFDECQAGCETDFIVKQLVDKVLDDNELMPLYVEFLIEKRRNPELDSLFESLKEQSLVDLKRIMPIVPTVLKKKESYDMLTDVINGMILASNVLGARENFRANRVLLERLFRLLFDK
ncbi:TetR/AcrR family transcriptional regulator [Streptococcus pseudoporcinus]|uniref:Transcriptional regulator, TetR family n=1 Tax=Streptococcus pseudoporcinus LQ 940-04 TaxID=875093 RepID=G5KBM0_9STRE|nr:TetR/AcrR family transcriptional regulator [Streptococcus pseudoporcinus]EFR45256.1 transcriptional regulator, TetR family [Streptococcus pseudoporcinus SPIN 20026]EHI65590.1 transcriptional regulator, TetR family [Streptococcus pseudoporcinus LQ 940-04]VEF92875.1 HTH-type transcriptional regulator yfiR [Streptococcus pseudoporcinus]